ncbi:MAG: transporter substrate-binding domain-containing protein [Thermoplasmatota archaeon]
MKSATTFIALAFVTALLAGCLNSGTPSTGTTTTPSTSPTPSTTPAPGSKGTLKFGSDATYPPFENQLADGSIVGFDVDLLSGIENRTGYAVNLQNAKFDDIIPSVQSGSFDGGLSAFTITDARKQSVDFTVSYYDNELLVGVPNGNPQNIKTEADLGRVMAAGKKICTQVGTTSEQWLRDHANATNSTMILLDTFPPCADSVKRGDAVAMMIDRAVVRVLIQQSGGTLAEAFTIPTGEQFGIVIKKGNTAVLNAFNQAINDMKSDGSLGKLVEKWQV